MSRTVDHNCNGVQLLEALLQDTGKMHHHMTDVLLTVEGKKIRRNDG